MAKIKFKETMIEEESIVGYPPPKVGEDIYVNTSLYLSHGADDFQGGLCKVQSVNVDISAGKPTYYIQICERPNCGYNWYILKEKQEKLKEQFGDNRGYADPDNTPEMNRWD